MAIVTTVTTSGLEFGNRLDAELYRPSLRASFDWIFRTRFKIMRLQRACTIRSGTTPPDRSDDLKIGPILFKTTDIRNSVISPNGDYYRISDVIHRRMSKTRLENRDVLLNIVGATLDVIGRSGFIASLREEANITQAMVLLRCRTTEVLPGYLFAYLNTKFGQDQIARYARPTGQYNLNLQEVGHICIPVIPDQQQRAVEQLILSASELQDASSAYEADAQLFLEAELGLDKLEMQKQVGYTTLASDLVNSRRSDAEYFAPAAREVVRRITALAHTSVRENFEIQGGFPWNSTKFLPDNSGEPVVRIRNIKPNHIIPDDLSSLDPSYAISVGAVKARRGDVVVGMDGIRYFYASVLEGECYVNQRVCHLSPRPFKTVSPEYMVFIINSVIGQVQLMRDMTVATTVGHITNRNVAKLVIPTVSRAFHDEITALIRKSIDSKKESRCLLLQAKAQVEEFIEAG